MDPVSTLVPPSDLQQLRDQFPESEDDENWRQLFAIIDAGGWGEAQETQTGGGPNRLMSLNGKPRGKMITRQIRPSERLGTTLFHLQTDRR